MGFKRPEIKTRRLILRPLKLSDYQTWYRAYVECGPPKNEWALKRKSPESSTRAFFKTLLRKHIRLAKNDEYYFFGVFEKRAGELVGLIDFHIYERGNLQYSNFGYLLFSPHWGKGYGREAAKAGLKIGFDHLKLHRLEGLINLTNKRSIELAKAIGMKREGIKKSYWFEDGKWTDQVIYVAINEGG